jgi:hypothetical protein
MPKPIEIVAKLQQIEVLKSRVRASEIRSVRLAYGMEALGGASTGEQDVDAREFLLASDGSSSQRSVR